MFQRNILLAIGVLALLGGLAFLVLGFNQSATPKIEKAEVEKANPSVLVATRPILAGSVLRSEDMGWKELPPAEITASNLVRGKISETDFIGAVTRRDFGDGEALNPNEIVKINDRDFLSAALSPGYRAVSLAMDKAQGVSGLIMPGDRVDVILTQNLSNIEGNAAHKSVGETVLYNRRVIAVDKTLPALPASAAADQRVIPESVPDQGTVTLELTEREAEQVLVAVQIGKVTLAVRALEGSGAADLKPETETAPVWASDVSPALDSLERLPPKGIAFAGSAQKGRSLLEIIRGDKTELR